VTLPASTRVRIASLVPSLTELLVSLGLREHIVARTGFCIHPADAVKDIPKVGGTKDVNLDKLRRLAPTYVLVNVDENRFDVSQALREFVPHVLVTHPQTPQDNLALIDQMAEAFGEMAGVSELAATLRHEFREAWQATQATPWPEQRVLYLIWRDPWMTVARDTYIANMLASVNWKTLPDVTGGDHGAARYPALSGTEPWLQNIDRVLLSSEPYRFSADHIGEAQRLCPQARVQLVDGELLSWYGPRAAAGLRYLSELRRQAHD
jgi:ABC-type Fe3+-hydroxamate transport system substrate-binding protein